MKNQELSTALLTIPENWVLTPVFNKAPKIKNWQKGVNHETIVKEFKTGKANGIGLITGELSGFVVAIDCDGITAHAKAEELGGLPFTVCFTSGKEGRAQYLYLIPEQYRIALSTINRKVLETGKGEQLEVRYNASQSVLPPSVQPETGQYKWINHLSTPIALAPNWVIELLLSEDNVISQQPTLNFENSFEPIPLYNCLSKDDRGLIDSGASEGSRNDSGAKLARGLIGTEKRLQYLGYDYTGRARDLFDNYCDRCNPPINKERETIWRSAEKDNPTATLPDDALENCVKAWQRKQKPSVKSTQNFNYRTSGTAALKPEAKSNVIEFPQQRESMSNEEIEERVKEIIDKNLSKSRTHLALISLAQESYKHPKTIQEYHEKLKAEREQDADNDFLKIELNELLKISNQSLELRKYLPGNLKQIGELANRLCLRPELAVSAFYTVASSLLPVGSRVHLLDYTDFDQPLGMYSLICAEPSQKKSPLINKIALEPLKALREQAREQFKNQMRVYEIKHKLWSKEDNPDEPEPVKPVERQYYINTKSQAGLRDKLNEQTKQGWGLMIVTDELAGNLKNQSKSYNAGLTEDLLSYYDGFGKVEALKDGLAGDFAECLVSVLGSIQPNVVKDFNNGSDNNGQWSRFNVVNQPISPFIIPDPLPAGINVKEMLTDFYKKLSELPKLSLRLTDEATKYFIKLNNRCEEHRVNAKTQALASLWGKMPGKIGRFAALIHVVEQVWTQGEVKDNKIKASTLNRAAELAWFYLSESQSLYSNCTENELVPQLAKILDRAKKLQTAISARDVKQHEKGTFGKVEPDEIREYFKQLANLGYGRTEGKGCQLKFKFVEIVEECRSAVEKIVEAEQPIDNGLQPIVEIVEKKEKKISIDTTPPIMDDPPVLDGKNKNKGIVEEFSTISTNPSNTYPEENLASTISSTEVLQSSTISTKPDDSELSLEVQPIIFDDLQAGDILFNKEGQPHQLEKRNGQLWQTHKNEYVSRNNIKTGEYHHATIDDVAGLIRQIIATKNGKQAEWLCKVYGGSEDSLMAQAILRDDKELGAIFNLF